MNPNNTHITANRIAADLRGAAHTPAPTISAHPTVYYNKPDRIYWLETAAADYIPLARGDLYHHLMSAGLSGKSVNGEGLSPVDREIMRIQRSNHVDFVGALGGHRKGLVQFGSTRCLIVDEPKFITPQPGDCALILGILSGMFGNKQLDHLLGWIKVSLEMFETQSWLAGQAVVLCGPAGAGKNLVATLLQHLFGGRMPGKPYQYMTSRTTFNGDFLGTELLTIEDEAEGKTIKDRRNFGAAIKNMSVNAVQRLHDKGKRALTVNVFQRLVISLNEEPEALLVLPPVDPGIEDKMMLFKVAKHPMPMPTTSAAEQKAFLDALLSELPAFAHHILNWAIPTSLMSPRFGIMHFHHRDLLDSLEELSPERRLLDLIDAYVFGTGVASGSWEGGSIELERLLKNSSDSRCEKEADKLLPGTNSCGVYLGRLAKTHPDRVSPRTLTGHKVWRIEEAASTPKSGPMAINTAGLLAKLQAGNPAPAATSAPTST